MADKPNNEIQAQSDFIVVGAGAAGSVLAAELSASARKSSSSNPEDPS